MISGALCPRDTLALTACRAPQGQRVDRCGRCEGLWLPSLVVASILGHEPDTARLSAAAGSSGHTRLCCPDDGSAMVALHLRRTEMDVCRRCGGVWLDRGELEQILRGHDDEEDEGVDLAEAAELGIDLGDSLVERFAVRHAVGKPAPVTLVDQAQDRPLKALGMEPAEASMHEVPAGASAFDSLVEAAPPTELASSGGDALQAIFDFVGEALAGL